MGHRWREVPSAVVGARVESPPGDGREGDKGRVYAVVQEGSGLAPPGRKY